MTQNDFRVTLGIVAALVYYLLGLVILGWAILGDLYAAPGMMYLLGMSEAPA